MESFNSVLGHERIKRLLLKLHEEENIPPFIIFEGPVGVGKAQMGYEFARLVMLDGNKEPLHSPDFYLIQTVDEPEIDLSVGIRPLNFDYSKEIHIEKIRELQKELSKKGTFQAKKRVVLILNGENLNLESQNSLLKTLEEPPSATLIIMVVSHRERILPTVYSRGRRFSFGPLKFEDFKRYPFDGEVPLTVLYTLSNGSIGRAKKIESSFIFASREQFLKDLVERKFVNLYNFLEEVAVDKARTLDFLDMFSTLMRDLYVARKMGEMLNTDLEEVLINAADKIPDNVIETMLDRLKRGYRMVEANVQRRYVLLYIISPLLPDNIRDKYDVTINYLWEL